MGRASGGWVMGSYAVLVAALPVVVKPGEGFGAKLLKIARALPISISEVPDSRMPKKGCASGVTLVKKETDHGLEQVHGAVARIHSGRADDRDAGKPPETGA